MAGGLADQQRVQLKMAGGDLTFEGDTDRLRDQLTALKESIIGGDNPQIALYVKTLSRLSRY